MENEFLNTDEAAKILGVTRQAVWRYINAGRLPIVKRKPTIIRRSAVESFVPPKNGRPFTKRRERSA